jgi:hypothetical protein
MQIIRTEERKQNPDEMEILWRRLHGCNLVRLRWARLADWQGWLTGKAGTFGLFEKACE